MKLRFNIRVLSLIIMIFPLIEPQYIQFLGGIPHAIYASMRYVTYLFVCVALYNRRNSYRPSTTLKCIIAYYALLLLLTTIRGNSLLYAFKNNLFSFVLCLIFDIYIREEPKNLIASITTVLVTLVIINFVSIILNPEGLYTASNYALGEVSKNWFLGYKNPQIRLILPAVSMLLIYNYITNKYLNLYSLALIVIGMVSCVLVDSGTAMIGMALFIISVLYFNTFRESRALSIRTVFIACLLLFGGIVIFNVQELFADLFSGLGRDITLTGRTIVWARYLDYIFDGHMLGIGILNTKEMYDLFACSHPHNYFLYVLLQGGIVGTGIIVYMIFQIGKVQKEVIRSSSSHVLICCIVVFLIMGISESLTECVMLYPVYVLAGNVKYLAEIEQSAKNKRTIISYLLPKGIRFC